MRWTPPSDEPQDLPRYHMTDVVIAANDSSTAPRMRGLPGGLLILDEAFTYIDRSSDHRPVRLPQELLDEAANIHLVVSVDHTAIDYLLAALGGLREVADAAAGEWRTHSSEWPSSCGPTDDDDSDDDGDPEPPTPR